MNRLRMTMFITLVALCVGVRAEESSAGPLVPSGQEFPGTWAGAAAWGDYDNDGDPDLVITGGIVTEDGPRRIAWVYRNEQGILEKIQELTGVYYGAVAWGDYDNDGDLDLALSGWGNGNVEVTKVYRNVGEGTLQEVYDLDGLRYSAQAWGDYDDDGDLDLVVSGMDKNGYVLTVLYRNAEGRLSKDEENSESLVNVHKGAVAWGDYDNDGDLDLAISGIGAVGTRFARIYRNDGGTLNWDKSVELMPVSGGSLAWGDYDGNGTMDLALSGWNEHWQSKLVLYRNGPPGVLREDKLSFYSPVAALAWGDYDNDGDLDLAVSGQTSGSTMRAFVLRNDLPEGVYMDASELVPLRGGALAWGDYDDDGDLDLFVSGEDGKGGKGSVLYTNEEGVENTAPSPPVLPGTLPTVTNDRVIFRWEAGEDEETRAGLTYILRVGTAQGKGDVFSDAVAVGPGNVGARTVKVLRIPLAQDTYYWSVRTVDAGFRRSAWPEDQMFIVRRFVDSDQYIRDLRNSSAAWGDYDDDGDPDLVLAGHDLDGNPRTLLYENVDGVLTEKPSVRLRGVPGRKDPVRATLAWGDYDNDGDLDLALAGDNRVSLYRNDPGTLGFDQAASNALAPLLYVTLAWGDYDNDGDLDLALMGVNGKGDAVVTIYGNTDEGFVPSERELPGTINGSLAWGDYDNDGDLDLAISGDGAAGGAITERFTRIYRNDPVGRLSEDLDQHLVGVVSSALAWGDYDNDGDLDLALTGMDSDKVGRTLIYENDPPGQLTERSNLKLEGVKGGSLAWGDYDNDGDLDLAVIGNDRENRPIFTLYRNDKVSFEEELYRHLAGVDFGTVSWCDMEGDGDLDLFTAGRERVEDEFPRSVVNDNLEGRYNPNHPPDPPRLLSPVPEGSDVLLSWEAGGDVETEPAGLTYTLRVGTSPQGNEVFSGATGLGVANVGHALSHRLMNLKSGVYYWSVRTVDAGLARSAWSEEGSFIIDTIEPVVTSVTVSPERAGIGQDVMVVVNFYDEHTQLDTDVSPTAAFFPKDVSTPLLVKELSYEGVTWTGTVTISDTIPSGWARLSVSGAQDGRGNVMETWTRDDALDVDTEVPRVIRVLPNPGQVGVARTARIEATFSEPIQGMTIMREGLVRLEEKGKGIPGSISYYSDERMIIFIPTEVLSPKTEYEAIVSAPVQDMVGNRMAGDVRWRFETAAVVEARFGGTIKNEPGTIRLYIPPNALEADQEVSLSELADIGTPPEGNVRFTTDIAFRFDPDTTSLRKPCALTVKYGEIGLPGEVKEEKLALFRRIGDTWTRLGGTVDAGRITTSVEGLGTFALFEDTSPPAEEFELSDVKLSPRVFSPRGVKPEKGSTAKLLGALPSKTNISFVLTRDADVTIELYNESGRLERVLMNNRPMTRGRATVAWDGKNEDGEVVSSGLYIAVIKAGDLQKQKAVAVLNK